MDPQRRAPREARSLPVQLSDGTHARVLDLSAVGLCIECPEPYAEKTRVGPVTLTFEDGKRAAVRGVVVWSKPEACTMGLELTEADRDFFDQLGPVLRQ